MVDLAEVWLWGELVGAAIWDKNRGIASFEFNEEFLALGIDLAPVTMPAAKSVGVVYKFPSLGVETYHGLPGLLADSLPDKYGMALIDTWLARKGRNSASFTPIERLCYAGTRGMGALEYRPTMPGAFDQSVNVDVADLVALAQGVMRERESVETDLGENEAQSEEALRDILRVGTSAGGARAKAIIAINDEGNIRSGQVDAPPGYEHWLLKFDGVTDLELGVPQEFTRIEYAYHLMARAAGITMTECKLLKENGRAHFLTKRFDRAGGVKVAMQSLCGMAHFDYKMPAAYGYEQAFEVMRKVGLPKSDAIELYRRMVFNVIARNQDDHVKNISFLMSNDGIDAYQWRLSPAYDVTYAFDPKNTWMQYHQMTIGGKKEGFTREDLMLIGRSISVRNPSEIIDEVVSAVSNWDQYASDAGVTQSTAVRIEKVFRSL